MIKIFSTTFLIILASLIQLSFAQEGTSYNLFKSKTYVKNPLELRDPFKRRLNKKKTQASQVKSKNQLMGIYSNINHSIESKPSESIRVIGVVLGGREKGHG